MEAAGNADSDRPDTLRSTARSIRSFAKEVGTEIAAKVISNTVTAAGGRSGRSGLTAGRTIRYDVGLWPRDAAVAAMSVGQPDE